VSLDGLPNGYRRDRALSNHGCGRFLVVGQKPTFAGGAKSVATGQELPSKCSKPGAWFVTQQTMRLTANSASLPITLVIGSNGVLRSFVSRQRRAAANEIGALLRHHQYASIDVRGDKIRHRGSITDT
jgi:hypothetical protein